MYRDSVQIRLGTDSKNGQTLCARTGTLHTRIGLLYKNMNCVILLCSHPHRETIRLWSEEYYVYISLVEECLTGCGSSKNRILGFQWCVLCEDIVLCWMLLRSLN